MVDQIRNVSGVLVGAMVSGALAAGALSGAPAAEADCASFFGIGNSANCTSTPFSMAIAVGAGATAYANGTFTIATAVGNYAYSETYGFGSIATQFGAGFAFASGVFDVAVSRTHAQASQLVYTAVQAQGDFNTAINMGGWGTEFHAFQVEADGVGNMAENFGGTNNNITSTGGGGNLAFNVAGSGNTVNAGDGPLAIAGTFGLSRQMVTQLGPGININNGKVGGAAAVHSPKTPASAGAAVHTGEKATRPAISSVGISKRTITLAASVTGKK